MKRKHRVIFLNAVSWAPAASPRHPSLPLPGRGAYGGHRATPRSLRRHPSVPQPSPATPADAAAAAPAHVNPPGRECRAPGSGTERQAGPAAPRPGGPVTATAPPPLTRVLRAPRRRRHLARGPRQRQQLLGQVSELPPVPLRPAPLDLPLQLHVRVRALGRHLSAASGPSRPARLGVPSGSAREAPGACAGPRFRAGGRTGGPGPARCPAGRARAGRLPTRGLRPGTGDSFTAAPPCRLSLDARPQRVSRHRGPLGAPCLLDCPGPATRSGSVAPEEGGHHPCGGAFADLLLKPRDSLPRWEGPGVQSLTKALGSHLNLGPLLPAVPASHCPPSVATSAQSNQLAPEA